MYMISECQLEGRLRTDVDRKEVEHIKSVLDKAKVDYEFLGTDDGNIHYEFQSRRIKIIKRSRIFEIKLMFDEIGWVWCDINGFDNIELKTDGNSVDVITGPCKCTVKIR